MIRAVVLMGLLGLAACNTPVSPERAADMCEERARKAQGPKGSVTLGVNSNSGGFANAEVGVTSDFLRGTDPNLLYDRCVIELTGEGPIRRPVLR